MDAPATAGTPLEDDVETIRMQADEHPLIEDSPPATAAEHCLRLMHLRAYDEAVGHAVGRDVLDIGCNTGYGTIRFTPVAGRVVGVDVSPRAIDAARQRAPDGRPEFVLTSGFELPFPDDTFDLVTSFQVLEHVPDPLAYLREIERVARPGGTVILATPNAATRLYPGMTPWNRFHVHEYVATELRDLLTAVFPQVRIRGMFGTPTLYETEIRRVDAARQRIHLLEEAAARLASAHPPAAVSRPIRRPRPLAVRMAGAVLPGFVRTWVRSVMLPVAKPVTSTASPPAIPSATPATDEPAIDLETFLQFSVADLFYADTDLDRAMDLLAVCHLAPAARWSATGPVLDSAAGPDALEATV